ncbi:MAG: sulfatase, partial [Pseudohongiellaceae bacterium]
NAAHLQPNEPDTSTREDYIAMLEHADAGIGQVLAALDEAGLREDTLVIYTNDNGGEWLSRNAPFFNRKFSVWEGGIRVPAIMRWPGVIPSGQVTDQVGITMDFTATFLALADATLPPGYVPEGIDLLPIVSGQSPEVERTLFWSANNTYAVRSGDYKLVQQGPQAYFVYDVNEDPGERNDLTNKSQSIAQRLYALLDAWRADVMAEREARSGD